MLGCERRLNLTCYSPKFCPAVKSTACEISSERSPAITLVHVPLVLSLIRTTCSRLSFTPKLAPGEFGAPTATHRAEAQASQTQSPRARQTVLGACSPVLVCLRFPRFLPRLPWHRFEPSATHTLHWSMAKATEQPREGAQQPQPAAQPILVEPHAWQHGLRLR